MSATKRKHVFLISCPAFGHYIPFLEFARKVDKFHDVTLAISSFKENDIRQRDLLPPAGVRFLPVQDSLDVNFDVDINPKTLVSATYAMRPHYDALLKELTGNGAKASNRKYPDVPPIDVLVADVAFFIASGAWGKLDIPIYGLCPYAANLFEKGLNFDVNTPTLPDEYFFNAGHEDIANFKAIPESFKTMAVEMLNARKYFKKMLFNSFDGLEGEHMELMVKNPLMTDTPAYFIGPLIPHEGHQNPDTDAMEHRVKAWLDKQEKKSAVYVSFGSIATASAEQLNQLGEALLALGHPFVWSLRPFQQELLPAKFFRAEKNSFPADAPYLILPWAPQKTVLAHPSTVVFVSHCGWNSTLEAVSYGIPVCAWPMFGDQQPNAVLLQAKGMAEILHMQGMKGVELLLAEKIRNVVETVAGWSGAHDADKYVKTAAKYGELAKKAVGPTGSSAKNFADVMSAL